jgi:hypothetical protein
VPGKRGVPVLCETAHSNIFPNICSAPSEAPEFNIVDVLGSTVLVHKNELMCGSVQRTHSGIVFRPNANVFEFGICIIGGIGQFSNMSPIDTNEMDRALDAVFCEVRQSAP